MRYHVAVSLSLQIKECALKVGFDVAGIAPLGAWKDLEFSRRWVEQGFSGEMNYLRNPKRHDPRTLLPSIQSIICVGSIYSTPLPYSTEIRSEASEVECRPGVPKAWISRYAWGRDYHETMREKLEKLRSGIETIAPDAETRVYVDTGPVIERAFARLSGIGWMGKNTCLINQQKGSWLFLGVVLTNVGLEADLPAPDRCGTCTRCIEACPTDALEPYVMNAARCISYLNIELKGSIPTEFRAAMGNNVFGCDICQDVCPWNGGNRKSERRSQNQEARRRSTTTRVPEFQPMQVRLEGRAFVPQSPASNPVPRSFSMFNPPIEALASITEEDFKRVFRDSPVKRAKYRGWLRNMCIAMGNSGDARFVPKLEDLIGHLDPIVREHAEWALSRLQTRSAASNPAP